MKVFSVIGAILRRELELGFRRWGDVASPLMFFVIVIALFPMNWQSLTGTTLLGLEVTMVKPPPAKPAWLPSKILFVTEASADASPLMYSPPPTFA